MVTKQEQLEWLAKECHTWNGSGFMLASEASLGYRIPVLTGWHIITREEWQQERDKMQKQAEQPAPDSSWHERGELPPVGDVVEAWFDNGRECWHKADVVGYSKHESGVIAVSLIGKHERKLVWAHHFRPLRTEREKAIDTLVDIICAGGFFTRRDGGARKIAERIYDAGLLK